MKTTTNSRFCILIFLIIAVIGLNCSKKEPKDLSPILESLEPVDGLQGDPVTLKGLNLKNVNSVTVGDKPSKIIQISDNIITTVVPESVALGVINIKVAASSGSSNSLPFTVLKTPEHVDNAPPALTKVIPAANFTDYPVLLYGNNLSGVIKISFGGKSAPIFTNNQRVVTTSVPKDLPAGKVKVEIRTMKGTSTIDFQVSGAPPAGPAVNFNIVNIPPPNYIPGISNQWSCGLFSSTDGKTFVDLNSADENFENFSISGTYEYEFDKTRNYNTLNYVEYTNKTTGETFAGQFSSASGNPCVLRMVLISSKTGQVFNCTFDRRVDQPDLQCDD